MSVRSPFNLTPPNRCPKVARMSETATQNLKRTPLCDAHQRLGARMVEFGGWLMPVQYTGIIEEHLAVRQNVGVFDISHMGEFWVSGAGAESWLNSLLTNDVRKCESGRAQYTLLCNERGGAIDDLIIYRIESEKFLLVVNAGNIERDFAWMQSHLSGDVTLDNYSERMSALALQGPKAAAVLDALAAGASQRSGHFGVGMERVGDIPIFAARTGYTGEDGFELICDAANAEKLWSAVLTAGAPFGIKPCGLGARDTLRLEMCYPLHGHELSEEITPLEAGLGMFVALDKEQFFGKDVMVAQKQNGLARRLIAFKMQGKTPPPRAHYAIAVGGKKVGEVTSGSLSPSLSIGIGMGFVETALAKVGTQIEVEIRDKFYGAMIEKKPLYKKA